MNPLGLRDEDIADRSTLLDMDYTNQHVVVFQVPERTNLPHTPSSKSSPTPSESGRVRTSTHRDGKGDQKDTFSIRSHTEFMKEVRRKDPNNRLYHEYGFTYLGRLSFQIPDFHVISRNVTEDDKEEYVQHLKEVFGATWISTQIQQPRPLRQEETEEEPEEPKEEKREWVRSNRHSRAKQRFDAAREARKARARERRRSARDRKEDTEAWGKNLRQSALRRNTLMTIHPKGPVGRSLSKPWTSRRLQSIQEEVRTSYARDRFPSDPLVKDQWFIHGGDYNYRPRRAKNIPIPSAVYLDVLPIWQSSDRIDGRGVVISIVDDGVNFYHSDLKAKFVPMLSYDFASPINDLLANSPNVDEHEKEQMIAEIRAQTQHGFPLVGQSHGTSVASIAAGSPSDGTCGTGVAPGAMISSIRVIGIGKPGPNRLPTLTEIQEALSLSYRCVHLDAHTGEQKMENMIYVISWGPEDSPFQTPSRASPLVQAAIQGCAEYGRHGYGSIYIMGSGNGKAMMDSVDLDGYASSRYVVAVGSISRTGYPLKYSEGGESLLVVAPGGDDKRGIVTATTMGAFFDARMQSISEAGGGGGGDEFRGEDRAERFIQQDDARTGLAQTGCTRKFTGTSGSAPMIGGVVAMMMQANPKLTWKDVQDILIRSCDKPHFGEKIFSKEKSAIPSHTVYRELLPVRLAQGRNDESFLSQTIPDGGSGDEGEIARYKGVEILNQVKSSMYIFYASMDGLEWMENAETGLHHSRLMGFGIPNVTVAISMSKGRATEEGQRSITNDYAVQSHNLVRNKVYCSFTAMVPGVNDDEEMEKEHEEAFLQRAQQGDYYLDDGIVRQKELSAWHVVLDPEQHPVHQIYRNDDDSPRALKQSRVGENFVMEHVELYVNATMPASIANSQIALCDRTALCSLFIPGMPYGKTTAIEQQLDYTFTSVKYWGQTNPYDGGWVILFRNIYPTRSVAIQVQELTLTVYGHYQ